MPGRLDKRGKGRPGLDVGKGIPPGGRGIARHPKGARDDLGQLPARREVIGPEGVVAIAGDSAVARQVLHRRVKVIAAAHIGELDRARGGHGREGGHGAGGCGRHERTRRRGDGRQRTCRGRRRRRVGRRRGGAGFGRRGRCATRFQVLLVVRRRQLITVVAAEGVEGRADCGAAQEAPRVRQGRQGLPTVGRRVPGLRRRSDYRVVVTPGDHPAPIDQAGRRAVESGGQIGDGSVIPGVARRIVAVGFVRFHIARGIDPAA